jgi:hypothetical protein
LYQCNRLIHLHNRQNIKVEKGHSN